ncbi:hypothetical protein LWI29_014817 [Acer saccharum]|uniref:Uncharacterized protein n=1 Tax=Acer saccharum TaxID=4024 RepID=A0AA39S753_ACESA|nr:hypothetical protein LWI29_008915 [Acer saccharum]KAK0584539.1 hypothetical protein LWI29_014817 [Acer saccharum]KAK1563326.1 hypothetical protein Q3G72_026069 [Acer saccharum]
MDSSTVQHINKKSSDELLRKFAQVGSDSIGKEVVLRVSKRPKRSSTRTRRDSTDESPSNNNGNSLVERKWLLPPAATRRSALLRQLGIGRSHLRSSRDINNRSLFGTIEKTWRRTVQGASRVFMEKHYNRHKRLINDVL